MKFNVALWETIAGNLLLNETIINEIKNAAIIVGTLIGR